MKNVDDFLQFILKPDASVTSVIKIIVKKMVNL